MKISHNWLPFVLVSSLEIIHSASFSRFACVWHSVVQGRPGGKQGKVSRFSFLHSAPCFFALSARSMIVRGGTSPPAARGDPASIIVAAPYSQFPVRSHTKKTHTKCSGLHPTPTPSLPYRIARMSHFRCWNGGSAALFMCGKPASRKAPGVGSDTFFFFGTFPFQRHRSRAASFLLPIYGVSTEVFSVMNIEVKLCILKANPSARIDTGRNRALSNFVGFYGVSN